MVTVPIEILLRNKLEHTSKYSRSSAKVLEYSLCISIVLSTWGCSVSVCFFHLNETFLENKN